MIEDEEKMRQRWAGCRAWFEDKAEEHLSPQQIQQLQAVVAENRRRMQKPWEHLSTGTLNAMADFSRWLSSFVAKVAKECSVAALVPDLLGDDRERSAAAWAAFAKCAESVVVWSNERSPKQWRVVFGGMGARTWTDFRKANRQDIRGSSSKKCSITKSFARRHKLKLPEFGD